MKVIKTELSDVLIFEPRTFDDDRGYFMESYNCKTMQSLGVNIEFVQDNHSLSVEKGTVRGLHYQANPMAQTKLVRVAVGKIYDVVVDMRKGSKDFGKWTSCILSAENKHQLLVPKGFAHGFCSLTDNTEVLYKVDEYYAPKTECGIIWNDKTLNIKWPVDNVVLSAKDKEWPEFEKAEVFL